MGVVSNEDCDLQVSEKGTGRGSVNSLGLTLEGSAGEVEKRRMRSEIRGPAKKVRENKSVCLRRRRTLPTSGMGTGSVRHVGLWRKKSYLLFLRLSRMSSVFKTRTLQTKSHANYPLFHAPHVLCTLTPCLKHCTLFLEDENGTHMAGTLRDPDCGDPQVILLQKPIYVMIFSATVAIKSFF